jgi:hypothetical protein
VIDSPALAQEIENAFDNRISANAYEVRLSDDGRFTGSSNAREKSCAPIRSLASAFGSGLLFVSVLPIEWLL